MNEFAYRFGACVLAAGIAFGGSAFGVAAAAVEPGDVVWDIDAYDDCMNKAIRDAAQCCVDSGGVPTDGSGGGGRDQTCQAPPANAATSSSHLVRRE